MAITDNPFLNNLINNRGNSDGSIKYCIKCGKQVLPNNKDNKGNEIPSNVLNFMWKVSLCLKCFKKGPKSKLNEPLERRI